MTLVGAPLSRIPQYRATAMALVPQIEGGRRLWHIRPLARQNGRRRRTIHRDATKVAVYSLRDSFLLPFALMSACAGRKQSTFNVDTHQHSTAHALYHTLA